MNLVQKIMKNMKIAQFTKRCMSASTIFSLSSGFGKCGVSVIRVSGPSTKQALRAIVGANFNPQPRFAALKTLRHPQSKEMIDKGLVLWFPGPTSFTGEDSCEFQVHGSLAVVAALLNALSIVPDLRHANPGEFAKRAFFGGKLDLVEAEGLADLIHAETEAQRKQALLQSTGFLSKKYYNWRKRLIRCTAHLEAYIDFGEDENIETDVVLELTKELQTIIVEIREHLSDGRQGEMLREGVRIVIIGAPNVGKSSFLNLMCQRNVSIVTPIAGTTRDIIESAQNFGGYPVRFSDTAGLRKTTEDVVEQEGISRAKQCIQNSDLVILMLDAEELVKKQIFTDEALISYVPAHIELLALDKDALGGKYVQLVANKIDLLVPPDLKKLENLKGILTISCKGEQPLKEFLASFELLLRNMCGQPTAENPRLTHARYRQQLERCIEHITIFLNEYSPDVYPDMAIAAQKLRNAVKCIERITGHVSTEDILDVVFKDFCIGK